MLDNVVGLIIYKTYPVYTGYYCLRKGYTGNFKLVLLRLNFK